ncbi:MAG: hypothetical protein R3D62_13205 [Xanthobacteraceae bacterium]
MSANVTISLKVSGADFDTATEKVRASGVKLNRILPRIRVLIGTMDETQIAALRAMPEVSAVELDSVFQLSPAE